MKPAKISWSNLNHKLFISQQSNIEMLVGVATLPHSRPPAYCHFRSKNEIFHTFLHTTVYHKKIHHPLSTKLGHYTQFFNRKKSMILIPCEFLHTALYTLKVVYPIVFVSNIFHNLRLIQKCIHIWQLFWNLVMYQNRSSFQFRNYFGQKRSKISLIEGLFVIMQS